MVSANPDAWAKIPRFSSGHRRNPWPDPQHTSASLTLNENCDPTVRYDMEQYFLNAVPDNAPYEHDYEGPDDMPSHIKSSMLGVSLMLPVEDGRVRLGTWQGIWLGEHRIHGGSRRIVATLMGE